MILAPARLLAADPDLATNFWAQLGAVGGLIIAMSIAVRVLYQSQTKTVEDLKAAHAKTVTDLQAQRDKAYADLDTLNRELRTSVTPTLAQVARALERLVDAQSRDRG